MLRSCFCANGCSRGAPASATSVGSPKALLRFESPLEFTMGYYPRGCAFLLRGRCPQWPFLPGAAALVPRGAWGRDAPMRDAPRPRPAPSAELRTNCRAPPAFSPRSFLLVCFSDSFTHPSILALTYLLGLGKAGPRICKSEISSV